MTIALDWRLAAAIVATALVAGWAASESHGLALALSCLFGCTLVALAAIDLGTLRLPDALTLPLLVAGLGATYSLEPDALLDHAIGAAAGFVSLAFVAIAYHALRGRDGMGPGDAKLFAAIGAWIGWQGLPGVLVIAAVAALFGVAAARVAGRNVDRQAKLPFGPFLAAGGWIVWLYGPLGLS